MFVENLIRMLLLPFFFFHLICRNCVVWSVLGTFKRARRLFYFLFLSYLIGYESGGVFITLLCVIGTCCYTLSIYILSTFSWSACYFSFPFIVGGSFAI